jgi:hypothetical protein
MIPLDAGSLPYPEMDIAQALRQLAPEDTAMVPWFTPGAVDVPASAVVPPAGPTFTPFRRPGATLAGRTEPVPAAAPETDLVVLARVSDSLRNEPREGEVVFAGAVAEVYRTGAHPVISRQPSARALLADERARYALAEIVYAAAREAEPDYGTYCPDCKAAACGWCEACERADVKAAGLYRLHDLILAADTYAAAAVLVARSVLPVKAVDAEGQR